MQGLSPSAIAEVRHISRDSAEGYLAEGIRAGFAYDWHRMGVPQAAVVAVARQAAAAWGAATADAAGSVGCSPACSTVGEAGGAAQLGRMRSEAEGGVAATRADVGSSPSANGASSSSTIAAIVRRQVRDQGACAAAEDLTQKLQAAEVTVKALKEALPEGVRYGQVRLALAHISRLGLLQQLLVDDRDL